MKIHPLHSWDLSIDEALRVQQELAARVETRTPLTKCELIAGGDVAYEKDSARCYAAVVVLRAADLSVVETRDAVGEAPFPYVPGLLSFREAPVLLEAFAQVASVPDVVLLDAQGVAHPRRLGLACHVGLFLDVPTVGCAKTRLLGEHEEPAAAAGSAAALIERGEVVGSVVRTFDGGKPLYVSAGHKIDLASAVRVVLGSGRGYRLPEPTRLADIRVKELRRGA